MRTPSDPVVQGCGRDESGYGRDEAEYRRDELGYSQNEAGVGTLESYLCSNQASNRTHCK